MAPAGLWAVWPLLHVLLGAARAAYVITVDASQNQRALTPFWKSAGFCPPLPHSRADIFDLSKDQIINLAYISSVPHGGIEQVRIHWLLELITVKMTNGKLHYNFTNLDNFMDLLWTNKLVPGFELMGSPSGYFTDFEDKKQVVRWKNLVALLAKRYIAKYGLEHVAKWNFETWNEPDHHDFDNVSMTVKGFLNYYDASSEGLREASSLLKFGGPGDSFHPFPKSPMCWSLLYHCYNGTNFFTGETGVRLDYISLHKKIIIQHQNLLISKANSTINYTLLSNDNAFMNYYPHYFTQRTLTARFQMNNTKPPHVQMVRKPVLTAMGLLALLGETQIFADVYNSKGKNGNNSTVGVLATLHTPAELPSSDSWQATILIYASDDNHTSLNISAVTLNMTQFPKCAELVYVTYCLDNNLTNPYLEWKKLGSPDFPSVKQFQQLRDAEDPAVTGPFLFPEDGHLLLKKELPIPSVFLIHVCARPRSVPNQVTGVHLIPLTKEQVAVLWDDHVDSKCIKTFEVEFSPNGKTYQRINTKDTIFTLWVYSPGSIVSGFYRVRAVDYWGKPGLFSIPVKYTEAPE
ncbi:alpha-L-iduronidase isoform X3 [Alligator sinensis]|uniref:Alpha-L-iduronidase isoform X3 n=1 Tax=Alligator sinensis TaxID=38654 RepID=A0A3Q0G5C4_ALLSI|nr:alpha-L-iduronidase isoform X3 [Alligator sinensis]